MIFKTQIHIHIQIRYFKSLPIATYYLTTIYIKNLYLHSKTYIIGLKWNLYLTSLSRRGPVNQLTQTFHNISLIENLMIPWRFKYKQLHVNFLSWPSKSANPGFPQYQRYKNSYKFTSCFENHWKIAAIISISTIMPLMRDKNHFLIWRHFPVVAM